MKSSTFVRAVSEGWSGDAFVLARSPPPVNIVGSITIAAGTALSYRPNLTGAPLDLYGSGYPGGKIFNKVAFAAAPPGQQGNFDRNVLRGFDATQADIGVQRAFPITEKVRLRFRAEFFNIFNHPNFGSPTQTLANALGQVGANGGFNPLHQIGGPRSVQLALKLSV